MDSVELSLAKLSESSPGFSLFGRHIFFYQFRAHSAHASENANTFAFNPDCPKRPLASCGSNPTW